MRFNFKNLQSVKFLQARYLSTSPVTCQFGIFRKILIRSDVLEFIKFRKNAPCLISHRLFHPGEQSQLDHLRSKPDKKAWFGLACGCISVTIIGFLTVGKFMQNQKASTRAKLYEQIRNGEEIDEKLLDESLKPYTVLMFFYKMYMNILSEKRRQRKVVESGTSFEYPLPPVYPNPPIQDLYDYYGENPYEIEEVVENKIWRVNYKFENFWYTTAQGKASLDFLGFDLTDEIFQNRVIEAAKPYGEKAVQVVKADLEVAKAVVTDEATVKKNKFAMVPPKKINMTIVKMNNGGLILYAPVKLHHENVNLILKWIYSLGNVHYIVVPSGNHVFCLSDVIKAFPQAKIIAPKHVQAIVRKLALRKMHGGFNLVEYLSTDETFIEELNKILRKEGIKFFSINGDVLNNSLLCLVDNQILLESDLVFGHHDGHGIFDLDQERLLQWKPEDYPTRLYKFWLLSKPNSPNGFLPRYRFWSMDPDYLGAFCYEKPEPIISQTEMADSLREILQQPFHTAIGVHFNKMSRDEFNDSINGAWQWLDGKSLK